MLRYLDDVVTLQLDVDTCNGCGMCVMVCPHEVFDMQERKAVLIDRNACIECGACAINCPVNAIQVKTGAGCASGILLKAIGKDNECSGCCGVSPSVTESTPTDCSTTSTEKTNTDNSASCCSN